jgi:transposase-like protein
VITRLTETWKSEQRTFSARDLSGVDYVYLWADGIALADGYRESTESWADLLRDCARRGMSAPVLAIGDGALGFWGALREVFPTSREQRCRVHYADLRIMPRLLRARPPAPAASHP